MTDSRRHVCPAGSAARAATVGEEVWGTSYERRHRLRFALAELCTGIVGLGWNEISSGQDSYGLFTIASGLLSARQAIQSRRTPRSCQVHRCSG
jgi:hypothetical protein